VLLTPYTTVTELRAWAVAMASINDTRRFLLAPYEPRLGGEAWMLETKGGLGYRVAGELLARLRAEWPTSGRTGARSHLTAMGVIRLLLSEWEAKAVEAEVKAERRKLDDARERERRLDDALVPAFGRDYGARDRWTHVTMPPTLGGRSPGALARESEEGLEAMLALLAPITAAREVRDSAGWRVDLGPEEATRLRFWASSGRTGERVEPAEGDEIMAHLHEHDRHVGVIRILGLGRHPQAVIGHQCQISWLLEDAAAAAARQRLQAAAAAFCGPDTCPLGLPRYIPTEEFLLEHLLVLGRRSALAAAAADRVGG
jgi:hypothetical protein